MSENEWNDPPFRSWTNRVLFAAPILLISVVTGYEFVRSHQPGTLFDPGLVPLLFGGLLVVSWVAIFGHMAQGYSAHYRFKDDVRE